MAKPAMPMTSAPIGNIDSYCVPNRPIPPGELIHYGLGIVSTGHELAPAG